MKKLATTTGMIAIMIAALMVPICTPRKVLKFAIATGRIAAFPGARINP